jgi:hypothetical protein
MHLLSLLLTNQHIAAFLWGLGIALQLFLFIVLFKRKLARRVPYFTALIGFYLMRSALLYLIYGFLDAGDYAQLTQISQSLEVFLLIAVAIELLLPILRDKSGWNRNHALLCIVFLAIAALCTWQVSRKTGIEGLFHTDRVQVFFASLMLLLWAWSFITPRDALSRTILHGFALYGVITLASTFGHKQAILHQNGKAYVAWSYASAVTYLFVVIFWLASLKPTKSSHQLLSFEQTAT